METVVTMSKLAEKQLNKVPLYIQRNILEWIELVIKVGISESRKIRGSGLHDEPLSGSLRGLRSIRLSSGWRLYYNLIKGAPQIIKIERIDKHKY
jgi:addiction module RelE/StbE family toxin